MSVKTNKTPDSDETARHSDSATNDLDDAGNIDGRQTSNKSGKHSSVEKLAASRPEFGEGVGFHRAAGAFGDEQEEDNESDPGRHNTSGEMQDVSNKAAKIRREHDGDKV